MMRCSDAVVLLVVLYEQYCLRYCCLLWCARRVAVDERLGVVGQADIFALGDCAGSRRQHRQGSAASAGPGAKELLPHMTAVLILCCIG